MRLRIRVPLRHPFYPEWVGTPARLAKHRCAVLSGTLAELTEAAARGVTAERAVFVLHRPESPFPTEDERDTLWETFQVPVMALLLDHDGRMAAWECEAQNGLHTGSAWSEDALWVNRLLASAARVAGEQCECGRSGPRLVATERRTIPRRGPDRERVVPIHQKELQRA